MDVADHECNLALTRILIVEDVVADAEITTREPRNALGPVHGRAGGG